MNFKKKCRFKFLGYLCNPSPMAIRKILYQSAGGSALPSLWSARDRWRRVRAWMAIGDGGGCFVVLASTVTRCARSAGDSAAVLLDLGRQLVGVLPRLGGDVAKRSQAGRMPLRLLCRRRWMPVSVVAWSTHGVIDARADPSNSTSI